MKFIGGTDEFQFTRAVPVPWPRGRSWLGRSLFHAHPAMLPQWLRPMAPSVKAPKLSFFGCLVASEMRILFLRKLF